MSYKEVKKTTYHQNLFTKIVAAYNVEKMILRLKNVIIKEEDKIIEQHENEYYCIVCVF